ncbi:PREDICTED: wall-associated receptor kinase 5-like [Nelumbo nucifera]|nr:PREDICTED: wall-associated receptor kinase 5-like [Nelumbo nucifera]
MTTKGSNFTSGCSMICSGQRGLMNGSCSGIGCCQTSIPKGLKEVELRLDSYKKHIQVWNFNPCSYAFFVDLDWYNFTVTDLMGYMSFYNRNDAEVPVVLDWAIEGYWCENGSTNDTDYACGHNSECFDSPNGLGYLCKCSRGYQGNPYLQDGCQDINECQDLNSTNCSHICINTPGSYYCSCPPGTQGDGIKSGRGCTPLPPSQTVSRVILISVGVGLGIGSLLGSYWLYHVLKRRQIKKRKERFLKRNGGLILEQRRKSERDFEKLEVFTSEELEKATDHYNENRVLGRGGQGTVYKGMLSDGRIVAVKKSKIVDEDQLQPFINEIAILSQITHRNVVKLFGCCLEAEIPLLVYELISGGSLSDKLHDHGKNFRFSWSNRLKIATEVARAIAHLHSSMYIPIYHRDIKSSNILLGEKYEAKVSDFGISRPVAMDQTHVTTKVQGTFGYMDPEYLQSGQYTEKSDVYSFGVVLIELLTGDKPIGSPRGNLIEHFISSINENHLFKILDVQVAQEGKKEDLQIVANLAMRCLKFSGKERPTMREVASKLDELRNFEEHSLATNNEAEIENFISKPSGLWDTGSTSNGCVSVENSVMSLVDEQPLLFNVSSQSS